MSDRGPQHQRKRDIFAAAIPHMLAQARGCLHGIEKRDTHTLLAFRAIILHWCLDGILRLQGAHHSPPSPSRREARYKEAFHIFTHKTPSELLDQLADLVQVPERDWPGVKALLILLLSLDALNLETRRRARHRGIRKQWETIRQGGPDATGRLKGLLRTTRVFGATLAEWGGLPEDEKKRAEVEPQDNICLHVLTELVTKRESVLTDLTVGGLPGGPFAELYPVRKPWWGPVAARLAVQDILQIVRELHAEVDDSLERYPLEAKDRLEAYQKDVHGELPADAYVALGGPEKRGKHAQPPSSRTVWKGGLLFEEDSKGRMAPLYEAPPLADGSQEPEQDSLQRVEAFVRRTWGRRMWAALTLRDKEESWETVAQAAGINRRELSRRRKILDAWKQQQGLG